MFLCDVCVVLSHFTSKGVRAHEAVLVDVSHPPHSIFPGHVLTQGPVLALVMALSDPPPHFSISTPLPAGTALTRAAAADCIVSDWAGFRSPFVVKFQSVLHIRNTIFLNSYLYSELVDVSFEGIVRFEAVSLANVSLTDGAVVDTTLNDYQQAIAYYLNYYAEDDEAYDVEVEPVPAASRGMFGAEFVIPNATMSDCVYTLGAGPGVVYPGCPPESEAARERLKSRSLGSFGGEPLNDGNPSAPGEDYSDYVASVPLDEDSIGGQGVPFPADYQGDYAGVPLAVAPGTPVSASPRVSARVLGRPA